MEPSLHDTERERREQSWLLAEDASWWPNEEEPGNEEEPACWDLDGNVTQHCPPLIDTTLREA